jgi:hypothetical protein
LIGESGEDEMNRREGGKELRCEKDVVRNKTNFSCLIGESEKMR